MNSIPKIRTPFRMSITGTGVAAQTVEQDSLEEVTQCVYAILATPLGARDEFPDLGLEDATFSDLDLEDVRNAVEEYEPRAAILTDSQLTDLVQRVSVSVALHRA